MKRKNSEATLQISDARVYAHTPKSYKNYLLHVPFVLRIIALILIILVLARPQTTDSWQIDKSKGRIKDEWTLTREQAEQEMNGDLVNIRSYAIYMSSQKHNADVIVAATFNVKTNDDGNGYKVTVIGYPATFINWKTAEASDYEWIRRCLWLRAA
jgi:hypothetical protein